MLKLLIFVFAMGFVVTATNSKWVLYKSKYGKNYDITQDRRRQDIYDENRRMIDAHNELFAKGKKSFYMKENQFTDMEDAEFNKMVNCYSSEKIDRNNIASFSSDISMPTSLNYVEKGWVTHVKFQGNCRSGFAFAAAGSLEGAVFKKYKKLISLSAKNLVDCPSGINGCNCGTISEGFFYVHRNGIVSERSYMYSPVPGPCYYNSTHVVTRLKSYQFIESGSEKDLQKALYTIGPIATYIDASHNSIFYYSGGVYDEPKCNSSFLAGNHGVLVVGYGTEGGKDYWLVKNSWGPEWGEKGYIKMSRNLNNQCGIASTALYPTI